MLKTKTFDPSRYLPLLYTMRVFILTYWVPNIPRYSPSSSLSLLPPFYINFPLPSLLGYFVVLCDKESNQREDVSSWMHVSVSLERWRHIYPDFLAVVGWNLNLLFLGIQFLLHSLPFPLPPLQQQSALICFHLMLMHCHLPSLAEYISASAAERRWSWEGWRKGVQTFLWSSRSLYQSFNSRK
jgi:hypothetical protein